MATTTMPKWSGVAKKFLIAITGFGLIGFLLVHLTGNLLMFVSPATFNGYSDALISNPLIYIGEAGIVGLFLFHLGTAIVNWLRNRSARGPVPYKVKRWAGGASRKSIASSTMIWTGAVILIFLPLHVATFKYGPEYTSQEGVRDLYRLVIEVFQRPIYVGWYLVAMLLLGVHLWHGASSAFQTVGVDKQPWTMWIRRIGWVFAVVVAAGFAIFPILVFAGLLGSTP